MSMKMYGTMRVLPLHFVKRALLTALAQLQELRPKGVGTSQLKALTLLDALTTYSSI